MLRAKRRRTRMHDSKGNPIFNTNNATSKQNNYVMKNNYLESLKIKGNDHNKCKRYYSDKEVIEKHQINLKNSSLLINFSSHEFKNGTYDCETGLTSALYQNTNKLSGRYEFYKNFTYYIDSPIKAKDYKNVEVDSVVFLTYVSAGQIGFWGIIGFPILPSHNTYEQAVDYWYNTIIIGGPLTYTDFISDCSVLLHQLGSNDITKYYNSTWNERNYTADPITVTMFPDTNHSNADILKNVLIARYCKTSIEQNPILGYRKQLLVCENSFEDIIITYNKLVKDGKIDISFNSIPFTFEYPLCCTFSSNMNLFNGVYKHDGDAYVNENNSSFGFAYITGDKIWKFINQYTENNQSIQIIITSNTTDIFDIIKLEGINLNWTITIKIDGIAIPSDNINPSTFTSDLSVKYDEIHVKVSKIIKKFLQGAAIKNPTNTIYKDNYAKTCGKFRKEDSSLGKFCAYNNVILTKQNNNGIVDASYNYSTSQYLSRPNFMKCNNVYKKSNPRFSTQGAVSGGSRLNRLKYQTIVKSQQKHNTLNNKNISNMVNGVYPTNLYRNTRPIYKQIYSKNVKCKGRSCNGLLQICPK
jgi:hypothetical protein